MQWTLCEAIVVNRKIGPTIIERQSRNNGLACCTLSELEDLIDFIPGTDGEEKLQQDQLQPGWRANAAPEVMTISKPNVMIAINSLIKAGCHLSPCVDWRCAYICIVLCSAVCYLTYGCSRHVKQW